MNIFNHSGDSEYYENVINRLNTLRIWLHNDLSSCVKRTWQILNTLEIGLLLSPGKSICWSLLISDGIILPVIIVLGLLWWPCNRNFYVLNLQLLHNGIYSSLCQSLSSMLTLTDTRHFFFFFASKDFKLLGFLTFFDYAYTSTNSMSFW